MSEELSTAIDSINKEWDDLRSDMFEFSQGPSDFQMEVYVANGEGPPDVLPCHTYRHLLAQVKPILSELRRLIIDRERQQRAVKRLQDRANQVAKLKVVPEEDLDLDLDLLQDKNALDEIEIAIKGKWQQYNTFNKMLKYLKAKHGPFTNERLQKDEWKYWVMRLSRQMMDSLNGAQSGFGAGNVGSARMATQGSVLPDSPHRIPSLPGDLESLSMLAEGNVDALEEFFQQNQITDTATTPKEIK